MATIKREAGDKTKGFTLQKQHFHFRLSPHEFRVSGARFGL
ncbi:hypothetical protein CLV32_1341 [Pedobacter duraquae]|uniref:Uncharacterized protein n=1 Tax=Pedobacter duraquae TaxID=425511 RepID=A0A4R6IK31_9SPHI|nr:hypothetical protein CLV32_1341 [Pedobacter duraquae]